MPQIIEAIIYMKVAFIISVGIYVSGIIIGLASRFLNIGKLLDYISTLTKTYTTSASLLVETIVEKPTSVKAKLIIKRNFYFTNLLTISGVVFGIPTIVLCLRNAASLTIEVIPVMHYYFKYAPIQWLSIFIIETIAVILATAMGVHIGYIQLAALLDAIPTGIDIYSVIAVYLCLWITVILLLVVAGFLEARRIAV